MIKRHRITTISSSQPYLWNQGVVWNFSNPQNLSWGSNLVTGVNQSSFFPKLGVNMSRNINVYILLLSNSLTYGSMTQDHSYIDSTGLYLWNLCWVELFGPRTHLSNRLLKLVQVIQIAAFWDALFSPVSLFSVLIKVAWGFPLTLDLLFSMILFPLN